MGTQRNEQNLINLKKGAGKRFGVWGRFQNCPINLANKSLLKCRLDLVGS
jgi:hypothetical protein